jgi:hypothetical protein
MKPGSDQFLLFMALIDPFIQFCPKLPGEETTPKEQVNPQTTQEIIEHVMRLQNRPLGVVDLVRSWLTQHPPDETKRETLLRWYFRVGAEVRKLTGYSDANIVSSLGVLACYLQCLLREDSRPMEEDFAAQVFELGEFLKWVKSRDDLQQALPIEKKKSEDDARKRVASKGGTTRAENFNAKIEKARTAARKMLAKPVPVRSRKVYGKWGTLEDFFAAVLIELADSDAPALSSLLKHLGPEFKVTRTGKSQVPSS